MSPYDSGQFVPRAILNCGRLIERGRSSADINTTGLAKLYTVIVSDDNAAFNEPRYHGKFDQDSCQNV